MQDYSAVYLRIFQEIGLFWVFFFFFYMVPDTSSPPKCLIFSRNFLDAGIRSICHSPYASLSSSISQFYFLSAICSTVVLQ